MSPYAVSSGHRILAVALSILMLPVFHVSTPVTRAAPFPFPDMERSWFRYRESVTFLRDRGAIGGYPDGTFKPNATVNRAELIKIVFTARGGPEPAGGRECFDDVDSELWYAAYVCAAFRRHIVGGYPDPEGGPSGRYFKPEQPVNTAEAVKIIVLAYGKEVQETQGEKWFEPYADELAKNDVFPRHAYLPWDPLTRERAADLVARMLRFEEDRTLPNASAGCGKAPGGQPRTVTVKGQERSFLLHVPDNTRTHDPAPLIVAFHGRTNSNERVRGYYGLDRAADDYFVAYPAAIANGNGSFSWMDGGDKQSWIRDVAFFDAIVEKLGETYCIDLDRVYTVGHSLGAWMANSVACIRGGIVRGSGTVGGDSVNTPCAGPTAAWIAHNPNDNLASFSSTEKAYQRRVSENACTAAKQSTDPEALLCQKHTSCDGGNTVVWCPHQINNDERGTYYPHTWPRGTAEAIVRFFEAL